MIEWWSVSVKTELHPRSPCHFARQPSARVSQTLQPLPLQSRDTSCYVSRPIPAPPPLWLQKHTDLRAHNFAHSPDLWHQQRLADVTCAWSWRLCGTNPATIFAMASWAPILLPFLLYDSYAPDVTPHGIASHTTQLRFFSCHFCEAANTLINPTQQPVPVWTLPRGRNAPHCAWNSFQCNDKYLCCLSTAHTRTLSVENSYTAKRTGKLYIFPTKRIARTHEK